MLRFPRSFESVVGRELQLTLHVRQTKSVIARSLLWFYIQFREHSDALFVNRISVAMMCVVLERDE
jgi:hypothetical protein